MQETPALCTSPHCRPEKYGGPRLAMRASPLCEPCEDHAYNDWRTVVRLWPQTVNALTHHGPAMGERVDGTPTYGLDLDDKALTRRAEILHSLRFWTRLLLDEKRLAKAPASDDVPAMAAAVATHIKFLTRYHDHGVAESVRTDAREAARTCHHLSAPGRSHHYRPGIGCVEHATDDQGQRVACPGEYAAKLGEQMTGLPDLVCTEDASHVLTPAGFRRLRRKYNSDGAARLLEALTG